MSETASRRVRVMEVVCCFEVGGSERLAVDIARDFKQRGHPIAVCATHTGAGPVSEQLERLGIPCFAMGRHRGRLRRRYALYRLFRNQRIDVLHIHHVSMLALCYYPARLAGVRRIVLTEHTDYELRTDPRFRRLGRMFAPRADRVTVIHSRLADFFCSELRVDPQQLEVLPNGVDTALFHPPGERPSGQRLRVGWVGRMHVDKDLPTLIRAFAQVRSTMAQSVELVLIGDGPERGAVEQLIADLGLREPITLLGQRSDIPEQLGSFDVVALSSRTEGVPLVLLESMATAVPVVATAVGGVPELLSHGGGVTVPPGDPAALARAIGVLLSDAPTRRQLGETARHVATARFDAATVLQRYRQLLDGPDPESLGYSLS